MAGVLVTGSHGQLGKEMQQKAGNFPGYSFFFKDIDSLDITEFNGLERFFIGNTIDYIVNCAAYTAVDKAETEITEAEKINITGVENLTKIAEKAGARLIHISTDYVFDGKNYRPYKEDYPTSPAGVYGRTKLEGEVKIRKYSNAMIIRTSWLYSSFGNNFVKTMLRLAKEKDSLKVVYDQTGSPTYAGDLAAAILEIIQKSENRNPEFIPGVFNYSNEGVCSWYDFAKAIMETANLKCHIYPIETKDFPTPAKRPHYSVLDKTKIKTNFNLEIPYWRDSLKKCLIKLTT